MIFLIRNSHFDLYYLYSSTNLNAGVVANGKFERTETGMPQGGPLSPLLSNIMLNELDKELRNRRVPNGTHGGVRGRLIN